MSQPVQHFNIVLYPPMDVRRRSVKISKKLHQQCSLFIVDDKSLIPHVTLYQVAFAKKDIKRVITVLKQIASTTTAFFLKSSAYANGRTGFVNIGFKKSSYLRILQQTVVTRVNGTLYGNIKAPGTLPKGINKAMRTSYRSYGYCHVGRSYYPHITFTKFDVFRPTAFSDIPLKKFSFKADTIALCSLGEHGTCTKLIKRFPMREK
jgi:hypothetical protein